ncbi:hypothetical protein GCM10007860_16300 [Chitiniphilus shinanonensis]|uniref:DUF2950 domain-containing protein n=1 Tax=Chitiniphilus shinanonensis TaxID=553088 RepID=A0ABQ6BS79_9NEIS|nr:DUF2950 domain-containing protein [Chitiniphilus shinanonensis]GLS04483.1 hypothetical protein GCM10007860_16300 [Chitiniphilus shinanonensis]
MFNSISRSGPARKRLPWHFLSLPMALVWLMLVISAHAANPKHYATPDEAVAALVDAARNGQRDKLLDVFGDDAKALFDSGDAVADREAGRRFLAAYDAKHVLRPVNPGTRVLEIGPDDWPFPIPLRNALGKWYFDAAAGKEELLDRRIGGNELSAIQVALAYVDAQREYHERNPQHAKVAPYADRIVSSQGKRDGLYWPEDDNYWQGKDDGGPSPLGILAAEAADEGYNHSRPGAPYHGYYYRILTGQGAAAPGGARDYRTADGMTGGFALLAWPASYGVSGVTSFLVNQDGVVYQRDLGPKTPDVAHRITLFNPDQGWQKVDASASAR